MVVQVVLQEVDFLHLKQSNRPFLGAEPQPAGAQVVPQAGLLLHLKQSNRPFLRRTTRRSTGTGALQVGVQPGAHVVLQEDDFLHLKQSKMLFFGADVQPEGAQVTGAWQEGLHTGAHVGLGAQVVLQEDELLHLKQSNKLFLGFV